MYVIYLCNIKYSILSNLYFYIFLLIFTNVDVQAVPFILQSRIRKYNYQTDTPKHTGYYLNTDMRSLMFNTRSWSYNLG